MPTGVGDARPATGGCSLNVPSNLSHRSLLRRHAIPSWSEENISALRHTNLYGFTPDSNQLTQDGWRTQIRASQFPVACSKLLLVEDVRFAAIARRRSHVCSLVRADASLRATRRTFSSKALASRSRSGSQRCWLPCVMGACWSRSRSTTRGHPHLHAASR